MALIITKSDTFYKIGYALENKSIKQLREGRIDEAIQTSTKAAWCLSSAGWLESAGY